MKSIKIPIDLHRALKIEAAKRGVGITDLLVEIVTSFLKSISLLILLIMTSCASTYTRVDSPNEMRYRHDQKIVKGMEMRAVMDKFGSPSEVQRRFHGKMAIQFVYYRAVFCQNIYCFVYFDPSDKEVFHYVNFRQEFTNDIEY